MQRTTNTIASCSLGGEAGNCREKWTWGREIHKRSTAARSGFEIIWAQNDALSGNIWISYLICE
jgi:hypothetical protein